MNKTIVAVILSTLAAPALAQLADGTHSVPSGLTFTVVGGVIQQPPNSNINLVTLEQATCGPSHVHGTLSGINDPDGAGCGHGSPSLLPPAIIPGAGLALSGSFPGGAAEILDLKFGDDIYVPAREFIARRDYVPPTRLEEPKPILITFEDPTPILITFEEPEPADLFRSPVVRDRVIAESRERINELRERINELRVLTDKALERGDEEKAAGYDNRANLAEGELSNMIIDAARWDEYNNVPVIGFIDGVPPDDFAAKAARAKAAADAIDATAEAESRAWQVARFSEQATRAREDADNMRDRANAARQRGDEQEARRLEDRADYNEWLSHFYASSADEFRETGESVFKADAERDAKRAAAQPPMPKPIASSGPSPEELARAEAKRVIDGPEVSILDELNVPIVGPLGPSLVRGEAPSDDNIPLPRSGLDADAFTATATRAKAAAAAIDATAAKADAERAAERAAAQPPAPKPVASSGPSPEEQQVDKTADSAAKDLLGGDKDRADRTRKNLKFASPDMQNRVVQKINERLRKMVNDSMGKETNAAAGVPRVLN